MINKEILLNTTYRDFISKYFVANYDFRIEEDRDDILELCKYIRDNNIYIVFLKDYFEINCYSNFDDCQLTSIAFYYKDYETLEKITNLIIELENFINIFTKYFNVKISD